MLLIKSLPLYLLVLPAVLAQGSSADTSTTELTTRTTSTRTSSAPAEFTTRTSSREPNTSRSSRVPSSSFTRSSTTQSSTSRSSREPASSSTRSRTSTSSRASSTLTRSSTSTRGITTTGTSSPTSTNVPTGPGRAIHPHGIRRKCVTAQGIFNNAPVEIFNCNGSRRQQWIIRPGNTYVRLASTNLCIDAGRRLGNGDRVKLSVCTPRRTAQQWFYTPNRRLQLVATRRSQCLNLPKNNLNNGVVLETRQCSRNSISQIWTL